MKNGENSGEKAEENNCIKKIENWSINNVCDNWLDLFACTELLAKWTMIIFCSFVKIAKQKKIMNKRGNHAKKKKKNYRKAKKKCRKMYSNSDQCLLNVNRQVSTNASSIGTLIHINTNTTELPISGQI